MSFNHHDNKPLIITLANYEEYLLLYVDDELTAAEKTAVENFAAQHPQVAEELEVLLSTKLTSEDLFFEDKESLLAPNMKVNTVEESLLLLVDDELAGKEKEAIEKRIASVPELQVQYNLLLKTKLDKSEAVIYPYKKELYYGRTIQKPMYWLRVAAVVLLISGATSIALWQNNGSKVGNVAITEPAKNIKGAEQPSTVQPHQTVTDVPADQLAEAPRNIATENTEAVYNNKKNTVASVNKIKEVEPSPANDQLALVENKKVIDVPVSTPDIALSTPKNTPVENNLKTGVTTASTAAYNPVEASDNDFIDAVATSENKKGRAIRGFLRKATRFIERTTNIDPVNEDDKLLIGAVALKLK